MSLLISLLVNTFSILIAAYIVPGVYVPNFWTALLVAIVLGILNAIVKPILIVLTIPVTILTLGLFIFIINVFIVMLASALIPAFFVGGFWSALFFSLALSIINSVLFALTKSN